MIIQYQKLVKEEQCKPKVINTKEIIKSRNQGTENK